MKNPYLKFTDEYFMFIALQQAKVAEKNGDVPIGALIVYENKIIGKGYNQIEKRKNPLLHAEIIAINKAVKKLKYKHLYDCTLYVILEPCIMCNGAIVLSRLKRVVYGASDPKTGGTNSLYNILSDSRLNHNCEIKSGLLENECSNLLSNFFKDLRIKKMKQVVKKSL